MRRGYCRGEDKLAPHSVSSCTETPFLLPVKSAAYVSYRSTLTRESLFATATSEASALSSKKDAPSWADSTSVGERDADVDALPILY